MQVREMWNQARKRRALRYSGDAVLVVVVFVLGLLIGDGRLQLTGSAPYASRTGLPATLDYSSVNQVYNTLRQNYDGNLSESQILDGLKHGLAEATGDPYTEYFTAEEARAFNGELQGISLSGIGAQLDQDQQGNIVVIAPLEGSPAAAAGLKAKDVITTIDGQSTSGMSAEQAVDKIRGPKGSKVTLGITRGGNQQLQLTITRAAITVPTATCKILPGNIGYMSVNQFSDDTFSLVQQAVTTFQKAGVKKVVLDLRDDPGGEVDTAQKIASLWLPGGALIEQEKRGNTVIDSYQATGDNPLKGMPTVVLVNAGTASAAEITALALHDNHAALIMGEKSYGKGVVQSVIPFSDGSELKVTIAKWYSPSGKNINHTGITPDRIVKEPAGATVDNDPQLQAAETYLSK